VSLLLQLLYWRRHITLVGILYSDTRRTDIRSTGFFSCKAIESELRMNSPGFPAFPDHFERSSY